LSKKCDTSEQLTDVYGGKYIRNLSRNLTSLCSLIVIGLLFLIRLSLAYGPLSAELTSYQLPCATVTWGFIPCGLVEQNLVLQLFCNPLFLKVQIYITTDLHLSDHKVVMNGLQMSVQHSAFVMLRLGQCSKTLYSSMDIIAVGFVFTLVNESRKVLVLFKYIHWARYTPYVCEKGP